MSFKRGDIVSMRQLYERFRPGTAVGSEHLVTNLMELKVLGSYGYGGRRNADLYQVQTDDLEAYMAELNLLEMRE